jgi:hemolysin activation/secretion protein
MKFKLIKPYFLYLALGLCNSPLFAANIGNLLPGSVDPGVVGRELSAPTTEAPPTRPPSLVSQPEKAKGGSLGPEAEKIKFKLNKIILEGNQLYSEKELSALFKDKLGKTISIADLQGIVQNITNYYRNNGYILTRAVLPPQHVANGIVHIRIIEGYISNVQVQGDPKKAKCMLLKYGERITQSKPLQIKVMEHYLRLANELPGTTARAVLEPSKTETGASQMTLAATQKTLSGYVSYDNYGTRYIGPQQVTASVSANSIFQSGDSTHLTTVRTARPRELNYVDFSHDFPLGTNGMRASLGANQSRTFPQFVLTPLKIDGDAVNFYGVITYPLIRSREQDLTLDGGVNYIDSGTDAFSFMLYEDHIRSGKFGLSYNNADSWLGANTVGAHIESGFNILGASSNPYSPHNSRFGADGIYTKLMITGGRLQQLTNRLSLFVYTSGQYSFNPLLATAQFAYGGSQLGRGYDPAEIIGDRGLGGSAELRMNFSPGLRLFQAIQPYFFYDVGVIWNIRNVVGVQKKQSAASLGLGARINFTANLSGNFMIAQPLTKEVATMEILGRGRKPRSFFSIVLSA